VSWYACKQAAVMAHMFMDKKIGIERRVKMQCITGDKINNVARGVLVQPVLETR
jgi:ribosomal protein S19E (S16A)